MLLQDVGEERNKLENRIEILKDELDYQIKNNEEYCNSLEKKFEKEKEEKLKNELNIIYHSHQKLSQKSIEFVEINEEKLNYYQNLAVNLKEELENIDVSHKKEISLVKELLGIQNMEKIEKLRKEYECKIKNLEMDKNASLNRHNDYVKDLEEVVNSLMFKISSLEAERNKLSQEIKTTNQEILKLYQQIQNYQNKIDELIPKYETDILKLHHKFSDEQNNLTFELKTLKKKMEIVI